MNKLPKSHERVIVTYRDKFKHKTFETIGYYSIHKHCWCTKNGKPFNSEIISWKPF